MLINPTNYALDYPLSRTEVSRANSASFTNRRNVLFAIAAMATLPACGFKLRGSVALPFDSIFIDSPAGSVVGIEVTRQLRALASAQGTTKVLAKPEGAALIVKILSEVNEKEVIGFSTSGRQREYQLRLRLRYVALDGKGKLIGEESELVVRRDVSTIDSQLTAKQQEDVLLYQSMQSDMAQQLLTRIAAIKLQ